MKNKTKMTIQLWLGVALAIFGIILIIASFLCPPVGVIDASVLAATGEVFTFSGSILGIDYHYQQKHFEELKQFQMEAQTSDNQ